MRMRTYSLVLVQVAGLLCAGLAYAQDGDYGTQAQTTRGTVLEMPRASSPGATDDETTAKSSAPPVQTPPRGMTRQRVVAGYGEPRTRHAPVGQPPITRWDYPGYRLYFEYDHVVHAVVPDKPEPIVHSDQLTRSTP